MTDNDEVENTDSELGRLKSEINDLREELADVRFGYNVKRGELEAVQSSLQEPEAKEAAPAEVEVPAQDNSELVSSLEQEKFQLNVLLAQRSKEMLNLRKKPPVVVESVIELEADTTELEKERDDLTQQLDDALAEMGDVRLGYNNLSVQLQSLSEERDEDSSQRETDLGVVKELQSEISDLRGQ